MRRVRVPSAAVVAVLAAAIGFGVGAATAQTQERVRARYMIYAQALAEIEQGYVEPVDARCTSSRDAPCGTEALVYDSIDGMLRTLDPHSSFFTPRDFRLMRERQEGRYSGIGIQIAPMTTPPGVVVTSLFEGSPAYRAGIRRGDVIARINGEDAQDTWSTQDVVDRVKGPKGTTVNIGIRRPGVDELIALTVARDEIRIPSVRASFMLEPATGYVRLQDFSETTNAELGQALTKLKAAGMQRLMLDLRDNPGGPLNQAIEVASRFLRKGEMVVYTRGRIPNSDDDYLAPQTGDYTDVPLIVLVDRQSASASEIVSGAMQDHDRGLVVGETTFGKALVQSVYNLSNGAGLALTTGRYYTPSGRLIQRPWDGAFDEYLTYALRDQEEPRPHSPADLKLTDGKRKVYSGGGVEPDHFIAGPEGFNPSRFGRSLQQSGRFVGFAERFTKEGDERPGSRSSAKAHRVSAGWQVTDDLVQEFRQYLQDQRLSIDEAAFAADLPFIKAMIKYEVDVDLFGVEEARRNLSAVDPQVRGALGFFDDAAKLLASR
ncbi:MAG: S41 family peptidase [Acidobacteria bacterium]|nr:S41 family peptidase [Acidobacteriota bacterium]